MIFAAIFFLVSLVFALLFWVQAVRGIIAKVKKQIFGTKNIVLLLVFGAAGWVFFFAGCGAVASWLSNGGIERAAEKSANFAAITKEAARKGWSEGLLKKLQHLSVSLDEIREVEDEINLVSSSYKTYEAVLIVENVNSSPIITYTELQKANIAYAEDENGVFMTGMILNHSALDEIPWILRFFAPKYRKENSSDFLPGGKSYLNIRFDVADGHTIKKIGFGETEISVGKEKIKPLQKDKNLDGLKDFDNETNSEESQKK